MKNNILAMDKPHAITVAEYAQSIIAKQNAIQMKVNYADHCDDELSDHQFYYGVAFNYTGTLMDTVCDQLDELDSPLYTAVTYTMLTPVTGIVMLYVNHQYDQSRLADAYTQIKATLADNHLSYCIKLTDNEFMPLTVNTCDQMVKQIVKAGWNQLF